MVQKNSLNQKVIVICGATASGKSSLAVELARKLDTEIISADSMNVYKGLNIGTAKPSKLEMQGVRHHLIDVVSPFENFSVGDYRIIAQPIIENLLNSGKIPIICGGTGFYINSLLFDLSYGNSTGNLNVRERYYNMAEKHGKKAVFDVLVSVDKASAEKLHPNDLKRVVRALEIYESGQKKSEIKDEMKPKYNHFIYAIDYPRKELYERIDKRVDLMFEIGLLQEVENLIKLGLNSGHQAMQGIGYKELLEYFDGKITLEQAISKIKLNTHHYAKRQLTFFKRFEGIKTLSTHNIDKQVAEILESL